MKKIILILTGAICLFSISSCSDFLNLNPSNQAEASTSIKTAKDAKVMIDGLMRNMSSSTYYGRNMMLYADAKGGDYAVVSLGRSGGLDVLYTFGHTAAGSSFSGYWSQIYFCMLQVNNLLANIETLKSGAEIISGLDTYQGQALTLRALMYFDLVRLYGYPYTKDNGASLGVPITTEVLDVYALPTRATVAEVYAQIIKDLTDAAPLLEGNKTRTVGYVNYYANKAILARVYLYMGRYAEALAAAEEVIEAPSSVYSLYTNTNWLTSWTAQNQSEAIFEIGIFQTEGDLSSSCLGYTILRRNKYTGVNGQFVASDGFIEALDEDPTDIRKGIMDYDELCKLFAPNDNSLPAERYGCCLKYIGNVNGVGDKGSVSAVNIKVIRLSEIYLIASEAALLKSPPDNTKAANYLQEIRKRSPELAPATAATVSIDMILAERRKELFGEGHRFFDLMRFNKPITYNDEILNGSVGGGRTQTIAGWNFYKIVLPISQGELDANPAIKEQQNPGY